MLDSLLDVEVVLGSLLIRREGTLVLGLGQEEESSDEHSASETSTKTVPTLGSNLTSDRAGKHSVDGSDDDLDGLLGHEVLAALVEEVHFLSDHGNEGLALSSGKTDDAASGKVELVSLGCSAHDRTDDQDDARDEDDRTAANSESERHTDDVTNTPMKVSARSRYWRKCSRILHEESRESHEMGDIGVVLAQLHVSGNVESQQTTKSTDDGETDGRD